MKFKYPEYEQFFRDLLCDEGEDLAKYASLFDFREPYNIKRRELTSSKYKQAWKELEEKYAAYANCSSWNRATSTIPLASITSYL
jgi:hypothetical protein